MFFILDASKVVQKPSSATIVNDHCRLDTWAMNPIIGGPIKKPRKLMVETAASANCGDIVLDFPAKAYTIGTTHETPTPTNKQPIIASLNTGNKIIVASPPAIKTPLNCNIFLTPNLVMSRSPINLPVAIVAINDT